MKNILLITSLYRNEFSIHHTTICHSFAKEWVLNGYNVKVVQVKSVFPSLYYKIAETFKKIASSYVGSDKIDKIRLTEAVNCEYDGMKILVIPIYKLIPHGSYSLHNINKTVECINNHLISGNFSPDFILGHFVNPQIKLVNRLQRIFPKALSSIVIHEKAQLIKKSFTLRSLKNNLNGINYVGFRSIALKNSFEEEFFKLSNSFINYSGIPNYYFNNINLKNTQRTEISILFVGQLIRRKFPHILVQLLKDFDFYIKKLTIIGSGSEEKKIINEADVYDVRSKLLMLNDVSRKEIIKYYDNADIFIMPSEGEAFGLVYLEAMSRGCITIGSKNEGIDGVIKNGINGFLVNSGDYDDLVRLIRLILSLSNEEINRIKINAIQTSKMFTDSEVAYKYINQIK